MAPRLLAPGLALLLLASLAQATWPSERVFGPAGASLVELAAGDIDQGLDPLPGVDVFATSNHRNLSLVRLHLEGTAWEQQILSLGIPCYDLAVGDGDRDNSSELYLTCEDSVWEVVRFGDTLASRLVTRGSSGCCTIPRAVAVGDGNADGLREVYVGMGGAVWRLRPSGSGYAVEPMVGFCCNVTAIAVGDGDRDNRSEVWVGLSNGAVWRVVHGTHGLSPREVARGFAPRAVEQLVLGDANHDGRVDIYAAIDQRIYRFAYDRATRNWSTEVVALASARTTGLDVRDADADGLQEVYLTSTNGHAYRVDRAPCGCAWQRMDLGSASPMQGLALGWGRQDFVTRLYVGTEMGSVVELTNDA